MLFCLNQKCDIYQVSRISEHTVCLSAVFSAFNFQMSFVISSKTFK